MTQRIFIVLLLAAAVVFVQGAKAGGAFERVVGVGADGEWRTIALDRSGPRSESVLSGRAVAVPTGGYVRVYPFTGGLPAVPGRFYPAARVLCLYWHEPVSNCSRLGDAGMRLLSRLDRLPLLERPPTAPVAVRYRSHVLRYADGNIFAALELALERRGLARTSLPPHAIALRVSWRGPSASDRPGRLFMTPTGVYASHRLFPLERGPWCYLAANLPDASAALIEGTARVCR
jgi:hypothetical protein